MKKFIAFSLLLSLFIMVACSVSPRATAPTEVIDKFVQSVLASENELSGWKYEIASRAIHSAATFLYEKDQKKFQRLMNRKVNVSNFFENAQQVYKADFFNYSKEFYDWADRNASKYHQENSSPKPWNYFHTRHFLIIYQSARVEKDIELLKESLDRAYEQILDTLKLSDSQIRNANSIAVPAAWMEQNLNASHKDAEEFQDIDKLPLVLTRNLEEFKEIAETEPDQASRGITKFTLRDTLIESRSSVVMRTIVPYYNVWSIPTIVHEIAHAVSYPAYTNIDSLFKYQTHEFDESTFSAFFPRFSVVTTEGLAYWALYDIGIFPEFGLLPKTEGIFREIRDKTKPVSVAGLLSGDIPTSFWDIIKVLIFRKRPVDKIRMYFIQSATFAGFLIEKSTGEQLTSLFTGGTIALSIEDLKSIYPDWESLEDEYNRRYLE